MKNKKITKSEFIKQFNEINEEYKTLSKSMKKLIKKSKKLSDDGEQLYIESNKDVFLKPSFKSLSKMMFKLDEINSFMWYL